MGSNFDRQKAQAKRLQKGGNVHKALTILKSCHDQRPSDLEVGLDYGAILIQLERFKDAVDLYAFLLTKHPKVAIVASNLGAALLRNRQPQKARKILEYTLELDPKNIYARINLGGVLQAQGELKLALENALEAVSIDPTHALAFNNLGSAFSDLAMFAEAKHAFETSVMLDPNSIDALINLAGSESKLGNHDTAIKRYEQVISMLPAESSERSAAVKFFAAFEYLTLGNLENGWDYYEGGFSPLVPITGVRSPNRHFQFPRWRGESLHRKKLLLWREQGLGDELLFASCIPDLIEAHPEAEIIFESEPRLVKVFQSSFPQILVRPYMGVTHYDYLEGQFDCHIPIGSLPSFFRRSIDSFNKRGSYMKSDPIIKQEVRKKLPSNSKLKVGICWRSGMLSPTRNMNYTLLDDWAFMGDRDLKSQIDFVNLQYGDCEREILEAENKFAVNILRWPGIDLKTEIDFNFALVDCLDAVISVNSSPSVYSGALGVQTIYLTKANWTFLGQTMFPWFSSFKVISPREFDPVSATLCELPSLLNEMLSNRSLKP